MARGRGVGEDVNLAGKRAHLFGNARQRIVRRDVRNDAAQAPDRSFELLQRRGIVLGDDQVDFLRQRLHRFLEANQIFRRRQHTQRVADFRQSALETGERARIETGLAAVIDALAKRLDFDFERLHRAPRECFVELAADFGEVRTDRGDRLLDIARRLQRLNARRDLAQLLLEAGKIDRRGADHGNRTRGFFSRH